MNISNGMIACMPHLCFLFCVSESVTCHCVNVDVLCQTWLYTVLMSPTWLAYYLWGWIRDAG